MVSFEKLPSWVELQLQLKLKQNPDIEYVHSNELNCLKFGAQKFVIPMYASELKYDSEGCCYGSDSVIQLLIVDGGETYWLFSSIDEAITSYYFSRSGKTLVIHLYDWYERESRVVILSADGEMCNQTKRKYPARY